MQGQQPFTSKQQNRPIAVSPNLEWGGNGQSGKAQTYEE
jgi:hypothetical protein